MPHQIIVTRTARIWIPDLACHGDTFAITNAAEGSAGKDAGSDRADDPADSVDPEDVEAVVVTHCRLHRG